MPTSEVIYRKVSTAGLIEMPNIKELKEIAEDDDERDCIDTLNSVSERSDYKNIEEIRDRLGQTTLISCGDTDEKMSTAMLKDTRQSIVDKSLEVLSRTHDSGLIKSNLESCCREKDKKSEMELEKIVSGRDSLQPLKSDKKTSCLEAGSFNAARLSPVGKLASHPSGANQRLGDTGAVGIRPIYPYCPYSPYGSPQGSPRIRRRPLRESRRVSIDNKQGAFQLNQYKLLDNIGQGSFGIVKLAYNEEDETHYAMKILSKKKLMKKAGIFGRMAPGRKGVSNPLAKVYREIALLKKLDHPNVVKLVEVLDDPDEDNLYLVFELVQKGEVLELPTDKPLDEETARIHFRDVVLGVEYLHYQRIVHRDIKPSNLLVDSDGRVKIADLGVSAELRAPGELLSGSAGTPAFAAPETTVPGAQYSGTLCDVWSMGVTLYTLVTGRVPWDGSGSIIGVQAAVRTEPLRFPDSIVLTDDLRDLIIRMLTKDPAMRASLKEIKTHRWLTNYGKEPLPSEADNCRLPVTVTDEEVARVVTRVPKLDTLILIKTMLKQHSFQNPFLPKRSARPAGRDSDQMSGNLKLASTGDDSAVITETQELAKSKTQQFHRAGRSNSAPDSYEWQTSGRQVSIDTSLSPVTEASTQETEIVKR
ncbi:GSCOCG00002348001-RA-CDS [Cotesia congregata]|nr:GSCOCG00002348001-RA-CDS [Cotesia congregata]